jgi:hypothetical protein
MNRYHLEVIGSNWSVRTVDANNVEYNQTSYVFTIQDDTKRIVASYPVVNTIISEIEYNITDYEI